MAMPKPRNRFLPTLTEVVHPDSGVVTTQVDQAQLIERLVQQVAPEVHDQLHDMVDALVNEQLAVLRSKLQHEIDAAVRRAVAQSLLNVQESVPKIDA